LKKKPIFTYEIRVARDSSVIRSGPLSESLQNCGELIITSKEFKNYTDCEKKFNNLISALSYIESNEGDKDYVLITRPNPMKSAADKMQEWDVYVVSRTFVADANSLVKKSDLTYNIFGQINADIPIFNLVTT
jgi:hypothetical protein